MSCSSTLTRAVTLDGRARFDIAVYNLPLEIVLVQSCAVQRLVDIRRLLNVLNKTLFIDNSWALSWSFSGVNYKAFTNHFTRAT